MARRANIDWEAIGRDYCAGLLSITEVATQHGVSDSQLRAKAKSFGWQRDLSKAIAARTKAKVATINVADLIEQSARESAGKSAETIRAAIEKASDFGAGVALRHQRVLAANQKRAEDIEKVLDAFMSPADMREASLLAATFKSLIDARAKLIDKERQAHGMDDADDSPASYEQSLQELGA